MKRENVVICPPCGESVAGATKEGQNWKKTSWPLLPRLTAVLPPQGREITTHGFTLIELLVVVLIIGILAAIAFPQYQRAVDRARIKGILPVMRAIVNAENLHRLEHGDYTYNWEELEMDIPHTRLSNDKHYLYLTGGNYYYELSDSGTYPHVKFKTTAPEWVFIYAAFPTKNWLCYPRGTTRGKALCKSLGCTDAGVENLNCGINPSR